MAAQTAASADSRRASRQVRTTAAAASRHISAARAKYTSGRSASHAVRGAMA